MSSRRRSELGDGSEPIESELETAFNQIVEEGAERLHRTWRAMGTTGFSGGLEIGIGVMGYLAVLHETGSHLLAGLPFSIGLIALLLAKSELFTENFLVPIMAVAAREASLQRLARLRGTTLVTHLLRRWLNMWFVAQGLPQWSPTLAESGRHFTSAGFTVKSACLAVLAGVVITLLTRMQHSTRSAPAQITAAIAAGFLLGGLQLPHAILDSLLIFGAILSGAHITYGTWLSWFGFTLAFNALGGLLLVTAPRMLRTAELIRVRAHAAPDHPDWPRH